MTVEIVMGSLEITLESAMALDFTRMTFTREGKEEDPGDRGRGGSERDPGGGERG